MWINRRTYEDLRNTLTKAEATVVAEVSANKAIRESNNWFMFRITQLEKERAVLLERMFGIKIAIPELQAAPTVVADPFAENPLNETMSFEDVGNAMAKQMGITHDAEGHVVYTK